MKKTDSIKLSMLGLPAFQTIDDFSKITHVSKYTIYQLSKHSDKYYKTYTILKKSGKLRTISQPNKKLKGIQSWILVNILNKLNVSSSCKGFEKGSSTANNVEPHTGANAVLTIDLKDFFPSVTRNQIYSIFRTIGYNSAISTILTNICTFEGALPQGSPCSPKLANLSAWTLDVRVQGYVGKRGITYTRYADDLSFSALSPSKIVRIIPMIKSIIRNENFEVNPDKTRIAGLARAKKITGLIITDDTYGIGKIKYKELRAKIHHLTLATEQTNTKLLFEVNGWLAYLNSVDKKRLLKANKYITELAKNHPTTLVAQLKC
jgi:RNA-directed DNA polymerase